MTRSSARANRLCGCKRPEFKNDATHVVGGAAIRDSRRRILRTREDCSPFTWMVLFTRSRNNATNAMRRSSRSHPSCRCAERFFLQCLGRSLLCDEGRLSRT